MARQARVFVDDGESGVYHVCSRVAGPMGWYPLADKENRHQFIQYLKQSSGSVGCLAGLFDLGLSANSKPLQI